SRDCQHKAWKLNHRNSCMIHPRMALAKQRSRAQKIVEPSLHGQIIQKLNVWMRIWKPVLGRLTLMSLNLGNHPRDRVQTHCVKIRISPRSTAKTPYKAFEVNQASVVPIASLKAKDPHLPLSIIIDPEDFTHVRLLVYVRYADDKPEILRMVTWKQLHLEEWMNLPSGESTRRYLNWQNILYNAINDHHPHYVVKEWKLSTDPGYFERPLTL
ncbi:hypothetical protein CPC08DRAFT_640430, partial [Agrocybe pediades]